MAVIITKEIRRRRLLLIIAGGLLAAALLIIYFGLFYQPSPSTDLTPLPGGGTVQQPADINIGIFDDARFKDLQSPPGVPIATDTPGKVNPFSD